MLNNELNNYYRAIIQVIVRVKLNFNTKNLLDKACNEIQIRYKYKHKCNKLKNGKIYNYGHENVMILNEI